MEESGIYMILNLETWMKYIWSSKNISERINSHLWQLRINRHNNTWLQRAYNTYWEENFIFSTICIEEDSQKRLKLETQLINNTHYSLLYNRVDINLDMFDDLEMQWKRDRFFIQNCLFHKEQITDYINNTKDMKNLEVLLEKRRINKEKIKNERERINTKLETLLKESLRLNNAISRARNYQKTKKMI